MAFSTTRYRVSLQHPCRRKAGLSLFKLFLSHFFTYCSLSKSVMEVKGDMKLFKKCLPLKPWKATWKVNKMGLCWLGMRYSFQSFLDQFEHLPCKKHNAWVFCSHHPPFHKPLFSVKTNAMCFVLMFPSIAYRWCKMAYVLHNRSKRINNMKRGKHKGMMMTYIFLKNPKM